VIKAALVGQAEARPAAVPLPGALAATQSSRPPRHRSGLPLVVPPYDDRWGRVSLQRSPGIGRGGNRRSPPHAGATPEITGSPCRVVNEDTDGDDGEYRHTEEA
jgi:hypothetical protein